MPKKKTDESTGILDDVQKAFIKSKVMQLGSMKAVEADYSRGDTVSQYARRFANWLFVEMCTAKEDIK